MSTVGSGEYRYRIIEDWAKLPEGWQFGILVGVAVDSRDRVYVCHQRQEPPIIVFDRDGKYVCSWGEGEINEGHIMTIAPDDSMYLVDRGRASGVEAEAGRGAAVGVGEEGLSFEYGADGDWGFPKEGGGAFQHADADVSCAIGGYLRFRRIP